MDSGKVIGDVLVRWVSAEHSCGEIGYVFSPAYSGRGFAAEAVHAGLHLAFDELGLHRVIARIDARNSASARLASRLGMRQEAHLLENEWFKGEWTDELDFAMLAQEWPRGSWRGARPATRDGSGRPGRPGRQSGRVDHQRLAVHGVNVAQHPAGCLLRGDLAVQESARQQERGAQLRLGQQQRVGELGHPFRRQTS